MVRRNTSKVNSPSKSAAWTTATLSVCVCRFGVSLYSSMASMPLSRFISHPLWNNHRTTREPRIRDFDKRPRAVRCLVATNRQLVAQGHACDHPTVAQDVGAAEITGFLAGTEREQLGNFLRLAEAFQGGEVDHGARATLFLQPPHRRVDRTRGDGHDAGASATKSRRLRLAVPHNETLAEGVGQARSRLVWSDIARGHHLLHEDVLILQRVPETVARNDCLGGMWAAIEATLTMAKP